MTDIVNKIIVERTLGNESDSTYISALTDIAKTDFSLTDKIITNDSNNILIWYFTQENDELL